VLFLYGPMIVIFVLSFQGPEGGLTFPMRGVSLHWFTKLAEGWAWWTLGGAAPLAAALGGVVMRHRAAVGAGGAGVSQKAVGGNALFYVVVASLIMPSIIVSLGIGLQFRLIDNGPQGGAGGWATSTLETYGSSLGLYTSAWART
jgi:putative spermidine/putrescine transport system permease protein